MKAISRFLSAMLLGALLCVFCLWQEDALPDLGLNTMLQDAIARLEELEGVPDSDGVETGPYIESEPVHGVNGTLNERVVAAATTYQTDVDVAVLEYDSEQIQQQMSAFFLTHPELFYVSTAYHILSDGSGKVVQVTLEYLYDIDEIPAMVSEYEAAVAEIVSGVPSDACDFDKILYLHDYFVRNYAYDYEGLRQEEQTGQSTAVRDTYRFFKGKVGVCQAYTLALMATASEVGIDCLPVVCDPMNHVWNLVQLDGEWYHIDITWDDAGGEQTAVYPSYISYRYFLLSGEALYTGGRAYEWEAVERAQSKRYDEAAWRNATTPMVKLGDTYYCTFYEGGMVALYAGTATEMEPCGQLLAGWSYHKAWSGILPYENGLLISNATSFYYYDAKRGDLTPLADLSLSLGGEKIYGVCDISDTGLVTYVSAWDYRGFYELRAWQAP